MDPLDFNLNPLLEVVRRCHPNEHPLRDRVIQTLRKNSKMLQDIADGEPHEYEGSLNTLRAFISTKAWPKRDEGWVTESCSLARYDYWFTPKERPKWAKDVTRGNRPGPTLTLLTLCASVVYCDCRRRASFTDTETADATSCLLIVDCACRLGDDWPALALPWLAEAAIHAARTEEFLPEMNCVDIVAPLALLAAWLEAETPNGLPVVELFELCESLDAQIMRRQLREKQGPWLARAMGGDTHIPGAIADAQLRPRLNKLDEHTREVVEQACNKLTA